MLGRWWRFGMLDVIAFGLGSLHSRPLGMRIPKPLADRACVAASLDREGPVDAVIRAPSARPLRPGATPSLNREISAIADSSQWPPSGRPDTTGLIRSVAASTSHKQPNVVERRTQQ